MTHIELHRMALDAMVQMRKMITSSSCNPDVMTDFYKAITALQAALAEKGNIGHDVTSPSEADELLINLGLNPVQYRTEGGAINHLKVKAAILHPQDYPQYVKGALVIPGYESGPMVEDKP